jgi:galactokinase
MSTVDLAETTAPSRCAPPSLTVVAPGRVNLIGEHTDYNDGLVLPMAIDRHVRCDVVRRPDRLMVLQTDRADHAEICIDLDRPLEPLPLRGSWAAYPCGVVAGFQRLGWAIPGFNARISATLPPGAGLSSSAALEVCMATVIEMLCDQRLSLQDKALLCQRAEHDFAGVPCGIMDQFAVTFAKPGHALLLDCQTRHMDHVPVPADAVALLVIHTGVKHSLADGEYANRRKACASATRLLGVGSLRDLCVAEWRRLSHTLPDIEQRRSRHVVTEHERTLAFVDALQARDWQAAGEQMYGSHASLRDDYEVSCPELDLLVELSRPIHGVFGCRMTGGGFGGCAVALVDSHAAPRIQQEFERAYRDRTGIDPLAFITRPMGGAAPVS